MRTTTVTLAILLSIIAGNTTLRGETSFSDPTQHTQAPTDAIGYPDRSADLDALPGFRSPPPGYGEVPFWWWTGENLDVDRLIWQLRELHKKGISGVQVNYSHYDSTGWLTEMDEPAIFTEPWWEVYSKVSEECGKLDMGIGLSTYTIDWPRGAHNLFYHLFYSKPELNAIELRAGDRKRASGGQVLSIPVTEDLVAAHAYPLDGDRVQRGGIDLMPHANEGAISWTASNGNWEVWTFHASRKKGSLNPLMAGSGDTVIQGFFQQFQDHRPDKSSKGLNYFFNDELHIGLDKFAWNPDFFKEFLKRKGYDLLDVLPAMWTDMGDITPKVRMDYADVRMSLMEERYFRPIYDWHTSRGLIFACDSGGRGRKPHEFGDYFRATRWYSAPGHDTPGGNADLIKGKVSSSIANLYSRPRVWLEGYHSLGWGATPERLMFATRQNYLYGCTLLNLHGLYYSTYGSHWEWAPPCYHFRMPYWEHMDVFLRYFDRLSYLMSQGHHVCDVAVIYPVAPYEAEMGGKEACGVAFDMGSRLMAAGINFEFIDNDSLARAEVKDGRLVIPSAGASYRALVFPNMEAVRWETIEKAAAFARGGGKVIVVGKRPTTSDRAGRNDTKLATLVDETFRPDCRVVATEQAVELIRDAFVQDVRGIDRPVQAFHRRVGPRDVYMVMGAKQGSVVEFRVKGNVELWDPWTGKTTPLRVIKETETGTQVELPLQDYEAQIVVFTPGKSHLNPPEPDRRPMRQRTMPNEWNVRFLPTMNNSYGDFRLPVTADNTTIGVEARRFAWARETEELAKIAMRPETDDQDWTRKLHGHGPQFYLLGPIPADADLAKLEAELANLKRIDPTKPVKVSDSQLTWETYDFSWRYGKEGNLGHQGYHGLKRTVTDDFLCLGKTTRALNETRYVDAIPGGRYFLWTAATTDEATSATIHVGQEASPEKSHTSPIITPAAVYINGQAVDDLKSSVPLNAGPNPTLVRYDHGGRGHFIMRRADAPVPKQRQKLAMQWSGDPGIIRFDPYAAEQAAQWFRFLSAPGTQAIRLKAHGDVEAWIDGEPMTGKGEGRFETIKPVKEAAVVALRIEPKAGFSGGAIIPQPVIVETDEGTMPLGDWAQMGVLNNYSGGVCYSTTISLTDEQAEGKVEIDLGRVVATAEVKINGKKAGVRVAPPWRLNISGLLQAGDNKIEVVVYNTLANHYQTIPSRYRGSPESGLFGPVRLLSRDWKTGEIFGCDGAQTSRPRNPSLDTTEPKRTITTKGNLRITTSTGSLDVFDKTIRGPENLMRQASLVESITGSCSHAGGGSDHSPLNNGTAGNNKGTSSTENDGRTFVGMGEGDKLDIAFDLAKAPNGITIDALHTYAGHPDARASQHYTVLAAKVDTPDRFVEIADIAYDNSGGLSEVAIHSTKNEPLAECIGRLRLVFHNGELDFSVYREIAIFGKTGK